MPYVSERLGGQAGPVIAVSDYLKAVPDQVARWVPEGLVPLGTDGYGLSDTRQALRRHFEIDAEHVVVAALAELASRGVLPPRLWRARSGSWAWIPRRGTPSPADRPGACRRKYISPTGSQAWP